MLKLSNSERNWVVLAAIAWLVALIGLIFIPMSRPEASTQAAHIAPTNSLAATLERTHPAGGAVAAQLIDPSKVYDSNAFAGYTTLCPNEPADLLAAKLSAFALGEEPDLGGDYGYIVLLPPSEAEPVVLDQVALKDIDVCQIVQSDSYPLNAGMPFYFADGRWTLGIRQ